MYDSVVKILNNYKIFMPLPPDRRDYLNFVESAIKLQPTSPDSVCKRMFLDCPSGHLFVCSSGQILSQQNLTNTLNNFDGTDGVFIRPYWLSD